jgi:hypothetical protein
MLRRVLCLITLLFLPFSNHAQLRVPVSPILLGFPPYPAYTGGLNYYSKLPVWRLGHPALEYVQGSPRGFFYYRSPLMGAPYGYMHIYWTNSGELRGQFVVRGGWW